VRRRDAIPNNIKEILGHANVCESVFNNVEEQQEIKY